MRKSDPGSPGKTSLFRALVCVVLLITIVYVGKPVLVPLALSVLITFILTPMVILLQRLGLKRVPAALSVVLLAIFLATLIGWGVAAQLDNLARDLPAHTEQIRGKITYLRQGGAGKFSKLFQMYTDIADTVMAGSKRPDTPPMPVVVQNPSSTTFDSVSTVAGAVLEPIASALLILILVVFMLIRREDLRNRVIGLLGHGRLTGTTRVTVEAAQRLSSFLLAQLCVNAAFGIVFGAILCIIGVPYWLLWGCLIALLRFIPYVGTWTGAAGPIILTFAIFPGWGHSILVLGVFIVLDLTTSNVVEPILFGHSTGVSPVALLVAAAFWTWVWGPVGLVLSTPLTVCLVVLGQHVPRFQFLATLLGDQPALEPHVSYYQRLLAGDRIEASQLVVDYAAQSPQINVLDGILIPTLLRTRRDRRDAGLTNEDETFIFDAMRESTEQLGRRTSARSTNDARAILDDQNVRDERPLVLLCPAHHRAEELSLSMLALMLKSQCRTEIMSTRTLPADIEAWVEKESPALMFVAVLPPGGFVQARYLCKRIRTRFPHLPIVVGYWGGVKNFDRLLVRLRASGVNYVTTSIEQTCTQVGALLASKIAQTPTDAASLSIQLTGADV